jgi:hypothetical protein
LLNGALLSLQVSLYRNLTVAGMSVTQYTWHCSICQSHNIHHTVSSLSLPFTGGTI